MRKLCIAKGVDNIKQIRIPLIIPSVDLHNGKVYIFSSRQMKSEHLKQMRNTYDDVTQYVHDVDIATAVRASCSFPGVFSPCRYANTELIDGGIRENVPWKETKLIGADKVISVVFKEELKQDDYINIIEAIEKSIGILSHELSNYKLEGADNLIEIKTKHISLLDTNKIDYLYRLGYKIANEKLRKIL
ncbi:MAG: hypothetical protein HFJ51_03200 [Clostridia bacterium]|nr:hypothetical protein [Clostridia bacterium]